MLESLEKYINLFLSVRPLHNILLIEQGDLNVLRPFKRSQKTQCSYISEKCKFSSYIYNVIILSSFWNFQITLVLMSNLKLGIEM